MTTKTNVPGSGYHHIALAASDYDKTVAFYSGGLGFPMNACWGEGDKRVCLLDLGDGNYLEVFAGGPPSGRPTGDWMHYCLRTDDCDAAYAAAMAAGAEAVTPPQDVTIPSDPPMPVRNAFFRGPDGELVEFFQHK